MHHLSLYILHYKPTNTVQTNRRTLKHSFSIRSCYNFSNYNQFSNWHANEGRGRQYQIMHMSTYSSCICTCVYACINVRTYIIKYAIWNKRFLMRRTRDCWLWFMFAFTRVSGWLPFIFNCYTHSAIFEKKKYTYIYIFPLDN